MELFTSLFSQLIPLYVTIAAGFVAGKWLGVSRSGVGAVVMYLLVPVVIFGGVLRAEITPATLLLPLLSFSMAGLLCFVFLYISRRIYPGNEPNILACSAGTGNIGYFGLPVAMALLNEADVGRYIVMMFGTTVFEASIGMYVAAKGRYLPRDAFMKVARIPILYAFLAGLAINLAGVPMPEVFWNFLPNVRGAYVVLGMMIVGLGLAGLKRFEFDWVFISLAIGAKMLAWPLLAYGFVWLDVQHLHFYETPVHQALLLLSIVPLAANSVVIASLFDTHPEKMASAVVFSTILALFSVPFLASYIMLI